MICENCGAENPENNRFCMKCGAELPTGVAMETGAGVEPAQSTFSSGPTPPSTPPATEYTPPPSGTYTPPPSGYTPPPAGSMRGQPSSAYGSTGIAWPPDQLVGFGPRFVAILIDAIALAIVGAILNAIHLGALVSLVNIAYYVYFWSTTGQTLGNMAMRIKVARADGQPLTFATGILRYVGFVISCIAIFIGLLWVLWDPNKQGWHDKIAGTVVVRAQ